MHLKLSIQGREAALDSSTGRTSSERSYSVTEKLHQVDAKPRGTVSRECFKAEADGESGSQVSRRTWSRL